MLKEQIQVAAGHRVFGQGDHGDCAYLIETGRIEILHEEEEGTGERCVATLGVHDIFGELALLGEGVRSASARAVGDVRLTVLTRDFFAGCLQQTEPIMRHLLRTVAARLQRELDLPVENSLMAEVDQARAVMQIQLTRELNAALERSELSVALQPIVNLRGGTCVGFEALARWQSPRYGAIPPSRFVPLAEDSGLIGDLGRYILRRAVADAATLMAVVPDLYVSINVSPRQFADATLFPTLARALIEHALPARQVRLEVTESVLMRDMAITQEFFAAARELEVGVLIDDFGTGYSALAQLHRFQIDGVKLDRSFINGIDSDARVRAVVRAVSQLCGELGIHTIAEGVETREQADACLALNIEHAQGYLYSPGVPLAAASQWLRHQLSMAMPEPMVASLS